MRRVISTSPWIKYATPGWLAGYDLHGLKNLSYMFAFSLLWSADFAHNINTCTSHQRLYWYLSECLFEHICLYWQDILKISDCRKLKLEHNMILNLANAWTYIVPLSLTLIYCYLILISLSEVSALWNKLILWHFCHIWFNINFGLINRAEWLIWQCGFDCRSTISAPIVHLYLTSRDGWAAAVYDNVFQYYP